MGKYKVLIFTPEVIFKIKQLLYTSKPKNNVIHIEQNDIIAKLINDIYSAEGQYSDVIKTGLLNQLMGHVIPQLELKTNNKSDNTAIQSILNYCSENFMYPLTLDDVAKELHLSKYYVSHLLNQKIGLGFNSYINSLRINRACDYLEDTNKKTSEISEEIGFGSIRSFNRAFLNVMDMTPLEYRKLTNESYNAKEQEERK